MVSLLSQELPGRGAVSLFLFFKEGALRTGKENLFRFDQFRMLVGEEIRKVLRPVTEILVFRSPV